MSAQGKHTGLGALARMGSAALVLAAAALVGCGGSGGGVQAPPAIKDMAALGGPWVGTSGTGTWWMLVQPTGAMRIINTSNLIQFAGTATLGQGQLNGTGALFGSGLYALATGNVSVDVTFSGPTIQNPPKLTLTAAAANDPTDNGTMAFSRDPVADVPATLNDLVGTYAATQSSYSGKIPAQAVVGADGILTLTTSSGTFTGQVGQPAANTNSFTITGSFTATGQAGPQQLFTGSAYLRPGTSKQLVVMMDGGKSVGQACGIFTQAASAPANPPIPDMAALAGAWTGTSGSGNWLMLVQPSGALRTVNSTTLFQVAGSLGQNQGSFAGTGVGFGSQQNPLANGKLGMDCNLTCSTIQTPPQLTLTVASSDDPGDNGQARFTRDTAANVPVTLNDLVGTYAAKAANTSLNAAVSLVISADGLLTLTAPNGSLYGQVNQPNASVNAFLVTGSVAINGQTGPQALSTGMVYLRPGSPNQLVFMTDSGKTVGQISGVFTKN